MWVYERMNEIVLRKIDPLEPQICKKMRSRKNGFSCFLRKYYYFSKKKKLQCKNIQCLIYDGKVILIFDVKRRLPLKNGQTTQMKNGFSVFWENASLFENSIMKTI